MPELLAPAGDMERLKYALHYGADAVYIGGPMLGLRANAINFTFDEIKEACDYAHNLGKKIYVTVNIVLHNKELNMVLDYLKQLEKCHVDAIIVSDLTIIKLALEKAHTARNYILDEVMSKCISEPRANISDYAPKIARIKIDPDKMSDVIGSRGKTIHRIISESGVDKIDTEDDGRIFIVSFDEQKVQRALDMINAIIIDPEPGQIFSGKVTRITSFGVFVEIAPDKEGLVHVSKLSYDHVKNIEDIVKVGDMILVKVIDIDEQGRINLSRRDALPLRKFDKKNKK